MVQTVNVVQVLLLLLLNVLVIVVIVVVECGRETAIGRSSGTTTELRSQYVIYAELQRPLGRTVQPTAGSGLHPIIVFRRTVVHTIRFVIAATCVPDALLQTVGHHHHV